MAFKVFRLALSLSSLRRYLVLDPDDFLAVIEPLLLDIRGQRVIEVVYTFEIILYSFVELLATYLKLVEPHYDLAFHLFTNLYPVVLDQRPLWS